MTQSLRFAVPVLAATLLSAAPATSHDFWLQPATACVGPGAATPFTLQVGHGADRQRSAIPLSRVTRLQAVDPQGGRTDVRSRLRLGQPGTDGDFAATAAGVWTLAFETDHAAQSHLAADRFNAYLIDEGLTPAIEWRNHAVRSQTEGSETYGRVAKALVQVGAFDEGASGFATRPLGLSLEIVPEISPYQPSRPLTLPFRVYSNGVPLPGALVKLSDLEEDAHPRERRVTDAAGRAVFTIPRTGLWQLNVVWTRLLPADSETEFETTFSSLTFGCR